MRRLFFMLAILLQPAIAWAVPDEIYVDPAINADSGTGTSGDPYGDVQYALNNINHGGDGARINVKAGTAEVLAVGGLSLDTYHATNGAPGPTEPIIIQGYTSAAGDGGIGEFTGTANSAAFWVDTTTGGADVDNASFIDLKITTAQASGYAINIDNYVLFHNVELISNHGGIDVDAGTINRCKITYLDTRGILGSGLSPAVLNSYIVQTSGGFSSAVENCTPVIGNVINARGVTDGNSSGVVTSSTTAATVAHNTILANISSGASASRGILISGPASLVFNNYIEGFNSTGDYAIGVASTSNSTVLANNAFFGNTTNVSDSGLLTLTIGSTTSLGASGVTSASGADFTPTTDLKSAGYPSSFLQLSGNANDPDIGAIQIAPSGSTNVIDPLTGTIPGL